MSNVEWVHHDLAAAKMVMHYDRLPVDYFVGGSPARTTKCVACGKTALHRAKRFVHVQTITLNAKKEPQLEQDQWCPVPAPLTDAQRRALKIKVNGFDLPVEKTTIESLEKRGLMLHGEATKLGRILLESGW